MPRSEIFEDILQAQQGCSSLCIKDLMIGELLVPAEDLDPAGASVVHPASACHSAVLFFGPICIDNLEINHLRNSSLACVLGVAVRRASGTRFESQGLVSSGSICSGSMARSSQALT